MVSCSYTQNLIWIACLAVQHIHSLITSLPESEHDRWPSFSVSFHVMVMVLNLTLINFLLLYRASRQRKLLTQGQGHTQTSFLALKRYFLSTVCIVWNLLTDEINYHTKMSCTCISFIPGPLIAQRKKTAIVRMLHNFPLFSLYFII